MCILLNNATNLFHKEKIEKVRTLVKVERAIILCFFIALIKVLQLLYKVVKHYFLAY